MSQKSDEYREKEQDSGDRRKPTWKPGSSFRTAGATKYVPGIGRVPRVSKGRPNHLAKTEGRKKSG